MYDVSVRPEPLSGDGVLCLASGIERARDDVTLVLVRTMGIITTIFCIIPTLCSVLEYLPYAADYANIVGASLELTSVLNQPCFDK